MEILSLPKAEVGQILLHHYTNRLNTLILKEYAFQQKYNMLFAQYEKEVFVLKEENFELWDDYIEWKAFLKSLDDIQNLLNAIQNGNFAVA